jgi:SAM-dependent methyltransferase
VPTPPPTAGRRTPAGSVSSDYFARAYAEDPDPWRFASSLYEAAKYQATLDALPRSRYARAFEVGCAIGVLTRRLADRADRLLAVDVAPAALAQARARLADRGHVEVRRMAVPGEWPGGRFDLVVVSEVGYYLGAPDLARLRERCADAVGPGGHLVLVHWTGETDYPQTGDAVHEAFRADGRWRPARAARRPAYRLDVLERAA